MRPEAEQLDEVNIAFVIHCWRQKPGENLEIRGEVACVQTAEKYYFKELNQIPELIEKHIRESKFDIRLKR